MRASTFPFLVCSSLAVYALPAGANLLGTPPNSNAITLQGQVSAQQQTGGGWPGQTNVVDWQILTINESLTGVSPRGFGAATPASYGSVVAHAQYGWARLVGSATISVIGTGIPYLPSGMPGSWGYSASFDITLTLSDTLTITDPSLAQGTPLSFLAGVHVDGGLSASWDTNSPYWTFSEGQVWVMFSVDGQEAYDSAWTEAHNDPGPPGASVLWNNRFVGRSVTVQNGVPFAMQATLHLYGSTFSDLRLNLGYANTAFVADFSQTMTWAGIQDLRDSQGNPVDDFSVLSASGVDYRGPIEPSLPIPEPQTWAMLLAGLGVVGLLVRRGRLARPA